MCLNLILKFVYLLHLLMSSCFLGIVMVLLSFHKILLIFNLLLFLLFPLLNLVIRYEILHSMLKGFVKSKFLALYDCTCFHNLLNLIKFFFVLQNCLNCNFFIFPKFILLEFYLCIHYGLKWSIFLVRINYSKCLIISRVL